MYEKAKVNVAAIPTLLQKYKGDLTFKAEENPYFVYEKLKKGKKEKDEQIIENVSAVIEDILSLAQ